MPETPQVIVEMNGHLIQSVWADQSISVYVSQSRDSWVIPAGAVVRMWYSSDSALPQYDPVAEGMTRYYSAE